MTILHAVPARAAACVATAASFLVIASAAHAAVFCVNDPACPAGGVKKGAPSAALLAADADGLKDTIRIGPGGYGIPYLGSSKPVDIIGAGVGKTTLVNASGGTAVSLSNAASSLQGLTVRATEPASYGIRLDGGADATDVAVTAPDSATGTSGFVLDAPGSVLQHVEVDVPDGLGAYGIYGFDGGTVRDAKITGPIGVGGTLSLRRAVIRASEGLASYGTTINASNVLITRHPRPTTNWFTGLSVVNDYAGHDGAITASNLTIDGAGVGRGIEVHSNSFANVTTGTATASVTGAIIRGVPEMLLRSGDTAPETANINIAYSSYDATKVFQYGAGTLTQGSGNHTDNPDPHFVNPAALDYRLRYDSPLLDGGRPTPLVGEENPDLAGHERVRDSNGDGKAVVDIGAYEYQRLAPAAAFAASPLTAALGDATSFDATGTVDPDGDPVTYKWAFGDGASGSGAKAAHTFAAPGSFPVTLTAVDATGLSSKATHSANVVPGSGQGGSGGTGAKPGACANPLSGTAARDVLTGAAIGELIRAGAGNDRLLGGAGRDCLEGQGGNDVLLGQAGSDRLSGGPGADRLVGGAGRNTVKGGRGNDRVNTVNGRRDRVDCGPGTDTVKADRSDRLRHCERVRRVRTR